MSDDLPEPPSVRPGSNLPEQSVSDLARALKRTVEDAYGYVRVRGEISQPKRHSSGHIYLRLKDDAAVIEAVCWKGTASRLSVRPEEGMEVVCTGKLTTYPGRSQYQLIIDSMVLAGEGALLKMLEDRKRRLAAEGLFAPERKRPLPFLPGVIGVITSPTGAVIRDILHRLTDRFPRHVLLWPVAVQGQGAAQQVAAAIQGFNSLSSDSAVPRPDLLIVARGGGSLEDLMAFNEEVVVRAAAASLIPLISAIGHETDTTLIDYASDRRAPTPTAAAEMAVPVRADLLGQVLDHAQRLHHGMTKSLDQRRMTVTGMVRGLGDPQALLDGLTQRLDDRGERLQLALRSGVERRQTAVRQWGLKLRHPRDVLRLAMQRLDSVSRSLHRGLDSNIHLADARYQRLADRLSLRTLERMMGYAGQRLTDLQPRMNRAHGNRIRIDQDRLSHLGQLLESFSYHRVLARGFALVTDADGAPITRVTDTSHGQIVTLAFQDGPVPATIGKHQSPPTRAAKQTKPTTPTPQVDLFDGV